MIERLEVKKLRLNQTLRKEFKINPSIVIVAQFSNARPRHYNLQIFDLRVLRGPQMKFHFNGRQNQDRQRFQKLKGTLPTAHSPLKLLDHSPPTSMDVVGSGQGDRERRWAAK